MKRPLSILLLSSACFEAPTIPAAVRPVALVPAGLVQPVASVELKFSGRARPEEGAGEPIEVVDLDDAPVRTALTLDGVSWRLTPIPAWPAGEVLRVVQRGSIIDDAGRAVEWPQDDLHFEVAPDQPRAPIAVRWPTPGLAVAAGATWFAVENVPDGIDRLTLRADEDAVQALRRETVDGVTRFSVESAGCEGLCPEQRYELDASDADVAIGVRSVVWTSSTADGAPPGFAVAEVEVGPSLVEVRWACDEPVWLEARLIGPDYDFEAVVGLGRAGVWRWTEPLVPGTAYGLAVTAVDLFGRTTVGIDRRVIGPAEVQVILREFVFTPRSDWGDSEPRGEPFDESPGTGTVSSADEWIEIVNATDGVVDIEAAALRIRTLDGTPSETRVAAAPALRFGDGGSVRGWLPGEALVVRPRGDMSQSALTVEVWAGAVLLERVVLGDGPDADHPGGSPPDLEREALSRQPDGRWRWCRPTPGDPRPNEQCGR